MRGAEKEEFSVKGFEGEESREDKGRRQRWSREQVEEKKTQRREQEEAQGICLLSYSHPPTEQNVEITHVRSFCFNRDFFFFNHS